MPGRAVVAKVGTAAHTHVNQDFDPENQHAQEVDLVDDHHVTEVVLASQEKAGEKEEGKVHDSHVHDVVLAPDTPHVFRVDLRDRAQDHVILHEDHDTLHVDLDVEVMSCVHIGETDSVKRETNVVSDTDAVGVATVNKHQTLTLLRLAALLKEAGKEVEKEANP